jgi:hypothetical protein
MPATYEPIATTTLGSAATSVDFTSIPSTYTDLVAVIVSADTAANDREIAFRLNSDANTNYSWTGLYGNGATAGSGRESRSRAYGVIGWFSAQTTTVGDFVATAHFMNYANTTTLKTVLSRGNRASSGTDALVSLWNSTSAISSISFYSANNTRQFKAGSTFTLYGIKAA